MTIASAQTLRNLVDFITPFCERTKAFGMTYGLGPAGYDVRIAEDMTLGPSADTIACLAAAYRKEEQETTPRMWKGKELCDPGFALDDALENGEASFALALIVEHIAMPNNLLGVVHDKSTWARLGLCVQNTVIEPGWRGYLTIELTNHSRVPILIRAGMPIAQIIFHVLDCATEMPYQGKYQDQPAGPRAAILED